MEKCTVFISHISEEKGIALTLKRWIEESFLGKCDVFVSSSPDDIPPGKNWLEQIKVALNNANMQILLCSPESLKRPWINFEAGFAWATEIQIIPLCHSNLTVADLPIPLKLFQALDLSSKQKCKDLFAAISKLLELKNAPPIDYEKFYREITSNIINIADIATGGTSANLRALVSAKIPTETDQLPNECISILKLFRNRDEIYDHDIRRLIGNNIKADHFRNILMEKELILPQYSIEETYYYLTPKGTAYIVQQGFADD